MEQTRARTVYRIITTFYFLILFYLTLLTSERLNRDPGLAHISGEISLIEKGKLLLTDPFGEKGSPYNPFIDVIGNILMFIPIPFLLRKAIGFPVSLVEALLFSLGISLFIETLQYLFNLGVSDPDDLILNVFGGLIGYGIYTALNTGS